MNPHWWGGPLPVPHHGQGYHPQVYPVHAQPTTQQQQQAYRPVVEYGQPATQLCQVGSSSHPMSGMHSVPQAHLPSRGQSTGRRGPRAAASASKPGAFRKYRPSLVRPEVPALNSPEEVARWIEERKRRYPTAENIAKNSDKPRLSGPAGEDVPRKKVKVCVYHRRGRCRHGDSCTFSHQEPTAADRSLGGQSRGPAAAARSLLARLDEEGERMTLLLNCLRLLVSIKSDNSDGSGGSDRLAQ